MLNTIGIKTLYVTGWAFNGTQTSGNETTIGHAWTAALIDGKWKEIDATWGLFEGIPSSHIFKNYKEDVFSYSTSGKNKDEVNITRTQNIKMITEPKFEKSIIPHVPPTNIKFIHILELKKASFIVPTLLKTVIF